MNEYPFIWYGQNKPDMRIYAKFIVPRNHLTGTDIPGDRALEKI
jgi:hypothetical protein